MKQTLIRLFKSLVKTVSFSLIVGYIAHFLDKPFLAWSGLAFIVQFVAFYMLNVFLEYKAARDTRLLMVKEAEILSLNTIKVGCASCKRENDVVVRVGQENRFTCGHCKVKNSVYLIAETAIVTEPIYDQPAPNLYRTTNGN